MPLSIGTKVKIGLSATLLAVLILGSVTYRNAQRLSATSRSVEHTWKVRVELQETFFDAIQAESSSRGFVITGDERYLDPFHVATSQVDIHLANLKDLLVQEPHQLAAFQILQETIRLKIQLLEETIQTRRTQGKEAAANLVISGRGKTLMDEIRRVVSLMTTEEDRALQLRSQAALESATHTLLTVYISGLLAVIFVLGAHYQINKDLRARAAAEEIARASEERARLLLNSSAEAIYGIDLEGRCTFCNPACLRMLGYDDASDLLGKNMHKMIHHSRADRTPLPAQECRIFSAFQSGQGFHADDEVLWRADGTCFPAEYWSHPVRREGQTVGAVVTFLDVSERMKARKELEEANEKLTRSVHLLEGRTDEITLLSQLGSLLQSCLTAEEAYGVIKEFIGKIFPLFSGAVCITTTSRNLVESVVVWGPAVTESMSFNPEDCWALRGGHAHCVEDAASSLACRHVPASQTGSYLCVPMVAQGEAMGILHLQCPSGGPGASPADWKSFKEAQQQLALTVAEHISLALANLKLRETLRVQSIRDPLTSMFNRRYMEESLDRELYRAIRSKRPLGAIIMDIDHFKRYNDTFGHDAGDMLLRELGNFLKTKVRGEDIACRYGGEEFVLIMPGASSEILQQRAEQLRQGVKQLSLKHHGQHLGTITISLGVALYPDHGQTGEVVLRAADTALYQAKNAGRDRAVLAATPTE
jgi:diguanylate cyclase (GGDEF)-like protein/PAS domain S-box-containing protein